MSDGKTRYIPEHELLSNKYAELQHAERNEEHKSSKPLNGKACLSCEW